MNPTDDSRIEEHFEQSSRAPEDSDGAVKLPFDLPTRPLTEYRQAEIQKAMERRRSLTVLLCVVVALTFVPIAAIIVAFILDPPEPSMPGGPSGGLLFILSLLLCVPLILVGIGAIGVILLLMFGAQY